MEYTVVYSQKSNATVQRKRFERASQQLDGILRVHDPIGHPKCTVVTLLPEEEEGHLDPDDATEPSDSSDAEAPISSKKKRAQRTKGSTCWRSSNAKTKDGVVYSGTITSICRANPTPNIAEGTPFDGFCSENDVLILDRWEVQIVGRRPGHSKHSTQALRTNTGPCGKVPISTGGSKPARSVYRPLQSLVQPIHPTHKTAIPRIPQERTTGLQSVQKRNAKPPATSVATSVTPRAPVLPHIPLPGSIRAALKPHQVTGVEFLWRTLAEKGGCILGDEMGLGKTLMTIACITALHRTHREKHFVVVCPSSLIVNWANEFDKWLGRASQPKRIVIREGGSDALQQIRSFVQRTNQHVQHQPGQVLIVSYDLFRRNANLFALAEGVTIGLLVVDEGHRLKSATDSLTFTALESLRTDGRLCITATPIQNNLSEFFNLAHFCCPGILGPDMASFRKQYERPIVSGNQANATRSQQEDGSVKSKELETISKSFMIRRLQKDVLQSTLPLRTEMLLFCRPSPLQCQLYRSACHPTLLGNLAESLMTLTTLRKICAHPSLHTKEKASVGTPIPSAVGESGKLLVLDALLQQIRRDAPDDKVVIVSNYTSVLSVIESLVLEPRSYSYLRLDGATANRQGLIDTFNRTSATCHFCLLLSAKAGGCGLNIVGANRLFLFDPDWNPATCQQAMGRIYRHGQTKPCVIYRLLTTGTVEEVIYQRQLQKGGLVHQTVDASSNIGKKRSWHRDEAKTVTKEELMDCFTLNERSTCCTKEKLGIHWPDYNVSNLSEQGCTDVSLLTVAPRVDTVLSFVHVVASGATPVDDEEWDDDPRTEFVSAGYQSDCDELEFDM